MKDLTPEEIKALPKEWNGNFFAKTSRWDESDPRSTIETTDVSMDWEEPAEVIRLYAVVEEHDLYQSFTFYIPSGTKSGVYPLGPGGIDARFHVIPAFRPHERYDAKSGEIELRVNPPILDFQAMSFRFEGHDDLTGETVEVHSGYFKISRM